MTFKQLIAPFIRYQSTLIYIVCIVSLNSLFAAVPLITVWGAEVSPMDTICGVIYVLRDFVQREIGHNVIFAMLIGGILSYFLADHTVAIASISAFFVGEIIDWGVYTFLKRPLSERILFSATLSSPFDSAVFLAIVNQLNWLGMVVLTSAKLLGVLAIWYLWKLQARKN
jgi:uncharacterized PurR-regulated membrane protein YhhQ (DUF165 family)